MAPVQASLELWAQAILLPWAHSCKRGERQPPPPPPLRSQHLRAGADPEQVLSTLGMTEQLSKGISHNRGYETTEPLSKNRVWTSQSGLVWFGLFLGQSQKSKVRGA